MTCANLLYAKKALRLQLKALLKAKGALTILKKLRQQRRVGDSSGGDPLRDVEEADGAGDFSIGLSPLRTVSSLQPTLGGEYRTLRKPDLCLLK